ncbi:hypothetical protein QTP88_000629 [Uroleucon formosanum]
MYPPSPSSSFLSRRRLSVVYPPSWFFGLRPHVVTNATRRAVAVNTYHVVPCTRASLLINSSSRYEFRLSVPNHGLIVILLIARPFLTQCDLAVFRVSTRLPFVRRFRHFKPVGSFCARRIYAASPLKYLYDHSISTV